MDELQAAWHELRERVDELGAERQRYLDLFELAADAYLVTDGHGVIREANGAAVDLLRRRRVALRGKPLPALVPISQRRAIRAELAVMRRKPWSARIPLQADGSVFEVEAAVRPAASGVLCWRLRAAA